MVMKGMRHVGEGKIILRYCSSCRDGRGAQDLRAALDEIGVSLVAQDCMNACGAPTALAIQGGQERAIYFFTGVDLDADRADILATLECYAQAPKGWIEDARACGRLRFCLSGRLAP